MSTIGELIELIKKNESGIWTIPFDCVINGNNIIEYPIGMLSYALESKFENGVQIGETQIFVTGSNFYFRGELEKFVRSYAVAIVGKQLSLPFGDENASQNKET